MRRTIGRRPAYDPPLWAKLFSPVCGLFGFWLLVWPRPYLPLVLVNAVLPPAALAVVSRWPDAFSGFSTNDRRTFYRTGGQIGWLLPVAALATRAWSDNDLVDVWQPAVSTTVMAAMPSILIWRAMVEKSRIRAALGVILTIARVGSLLLLANTGLDRSPGLITVYKVTGWRYYKRGELTFNLRAQANPAETIDRLPAPDRLFPTTFRGDTLCVETNAGLFGRRTRYLADCIGPARDLWSGLPKPLNEQRR